MFGKALRMHCGCIQSNFLVEGSNVKKLLALALTVASVAFASAEDAKANNLSISATNAITANTVEPQRRYRNRWGRNRGRVRVVTRTRLVHRGRRIYRETYQIRYLPNGRALTRRISFVRIR